MKKEVEKLLFERAEKTGTKSVFFSELWKVTDNKEEREEIELLFAEGIRKMALEKMHSNSRKRIVVYNICPYRIIEIAKKYGIFNRFYYCTITKNICYCRGQDYISERGTVRDLLYNNY